MKSLPTSDHEFAISVRRERERRGWSRAELADQVAAHGPKFHQSTIYKIENEQRNVTVGEAVAIARSMDLDLEEMYSGDSESPEAMKRYLNRASDPLLAATLEFDDTAWSLIEQQGRLRRAIDEFDELGHYLTNEEDEPLTAMQVYGELANNDLFGFVRRTWRETVKQSPPLRALYDTFGVHLTDTGDDTYPWAREES